MTKDFIDMSRKIKKHKKKDAWHYSQNDNCETLGGQIFYEKKNTEHSTPTFSQQPILVHRIWLGNTKYKSKQSIPSARRPSCDLTLKNKYEKHCAPTFPQQPILSNRISLCNRKIHDTVESNLYKQPIMAYSISLWNRKYIGQLPQPPNPLQTTHLKGMGWYGTWLKHNLLGKKQDNLFYFLSTLHISIAHIMTGK